MYTIDILAMSPGLDLSLSLYDVNGNLLAFNDDFPRSTDPTDPQNIRPRIQSYRVPTNSQYYIKVRDDAGRGGPDLDYTIEVQSETYGPTPTLIPEVCTDLFEPDGTPEQAKLITIREIQPNHRLCPAGDADWVRFFAKSGQPFTLSTNSSARAGADTTMILVDRDGSTILDFNDDSSGTLELAYRVRPLGGRLLLRAGQERRRYRQPVHRLRPDLRSRRRRCARADHRPWNSDRGADDHARRHAVRRNVDP